MTEQKRRTAEETLKLAIEAAERIVAQGETLASDPFIFALGLEIAKRKLLVMTEGLPGFHDQFREAIGLIEEFVVAIKIPEGEN